MLGDIVTFSAAVMAAVLIVAASRRLLLAYAAAAHYRPAPASASSPTLWVVCAGRNEARRLPRLIASLETLRYRGPHRIVLIDDWSTDESPAIMQAARERIGPDFHVVLLSGRQHGKADALREGLKDIPYAPDDLLFVIDADHRLEADALDNVANYFADPAVAAVAIEHPVDTPARGLVSAYCYLEAAISEAVISRGQHALGLPTKLAGSWATRFAVFERLFPSGWHLIDDTVFTARIVAEGGEIAYAADVRALQDVPDTVKGYWSQHLRWSAGYAESAGDALKARAGRTGLLQHLDAAIMHAGYFERPLLLLLLIVAGIGLVSGAPAAAWIAGGVVATYVVVIVAQILVALWLTHAGLKLAVMSFLSLPLLAVDMLISVRGSVTGLMKRRVAWSTDHRG